MDCKGQQGEFIPEGSPCRTVDPSITFSRGDGPSVTFDIHTGKAVCEEFDSKTNTFVKGAHFNIKDVLHHLPAAGMVKQRFPYHEATDMDAFHNYIGQFAPKQVKQLLDQCNMVVS